MSEEKKARKVQTTTPKAKKPAASSKKKITKKETPSNIHDANRQMFTAGDKQCYCYVSVNLTSNTRHSSIISIGAMTPNGDTFYGEMTDYNMKDVTTKVFEDVVRFLTGPNDSFLKTIAAPTGEVRDKFIKWLEDYYKPRGRFVQFVMDKVEWDWPIFKEFIAPEGTPYPGWISPIVSDLNNDLAGAISVSANNIDNVIKGEGSYLNFIPVMAADKDVDRIDNAEITKNVIGTVMLANKENALKKAMCIRALHQNLWGFDAVVTETPVKETPEDIDK